MATSKTSIFTRFAVFVLSCICRGVSPNGNLPDNFLLWTDSKSFSGLRQLEVPYDGGGVHNVPLSKNYSSFWGIDYNPNTKDVYLLGRGTTSYLYKFNLLDSTDPRETVAVFPSVSALDLAIHTTLNLAYVTDGDNNVIHRASLDGSQNVTTLQVSAPGSHPVGIAIDETNGNVYWTQYFPSSVVFARLPDLTDWQTIAEDDVSYPWALFVDTLSEKVIWIDVDKEKETVEMSNLDGSSRETIVRISDSLFRDVAIVGGLLYVTDLGNSVGKIRRICRNEYRTLDIVEDRWPFKIVGYSTTNNAVCLTCCPENATLDVNTCSCYDHLDCSFTCMNGGTMNAQLCECMCQDGWSGIDCSEILHSTTISVQSTSKLISANITSPTNLPSGSSTTDTGNTQAESPFPVAIVAGAVVGVVALIIIIVLVICCCKRRQPSASSNSPPQASGKHNSEPTHRKEQYEMPFGSGEPASPTDEVIRTSSLHGSGNCVESDETSDDNFMNDIANMKSNKDRHRNDIRIK